MVSEGDLRISHTLGAELTIAWRAAAMGRDVERPGCRGPVASGRPSRADWAAAGVGLTRSVTVRMMSECQHYDYATVDRPVDPDELADMRALSTWTHTHRGRRS